MKNEAENNEQEEQEQEDQDKLKRTSTIVHANIT